MAAVDSSTEKLRAILWSMAKGEDVWRDFLDLVGPFILHILKEDYCFHQEYDEHTRLEILHDIYLRVAKYAGKTAGKFTFETYKGYLRKIIRTVMSNKRRILRRWQRDFSLEEILESNPQQASLLTLNPWKLYEERKNLRTVIPALQAAINIVAERSRDPDKTAIILEQKMLGEAGYSEIAAEVGMDIDAVRHVVAYYREPVIEEVRSQLRVGG